MAIDWIRKHWSRTFQEFEFTGGFFASPLPANFGLVQLFNPAGSGRLVAVDRFTVSLSVADTLIILIDTVALTTGSGGRETNKFQPVGAAAQAQLRSDVNAGAPPPPGTQIGGLGLTAATPFELIRDQPWLLDEGNGLIAAAATAGTFIQCWCEWSEYTQ